jgi:hypothetical protein
LEAAKMRLNKETLREVGELLFGPDWITPLARALVSDKTGRPIDLRTVQRWANGQFEVPDTPHLRGQLAALARARGEDLEQIAVELETETMEIPK